MLKATKFIVLFCWLFLALFLIAVPLFNSYLYWWIFFSAIFFILKTKVKSNITFILTFALFFLAAILTAFHFYAYAEIIMRISFIGLILGYLQILVGYKNEED